MAAYAMRLKVCLEVTINYWKSYGPMRMVVCAKQETLCYCKKVVGGSIVVLWTTGGITDSDRSKITKSWIYLICYWIYLAFTFTLHTFQSNFIIYY